MSKTNKVMIIIGACLIGIGLILFLATGFATEWKFEATEWESKVYESDVEIDDIDLDFSAGTLKVEVYDGEKIKVEYSENDQVTTEFKVTDKTLKISSVVHWHVQFLWFNRIPETRIYIPKNTTLGLKFDIDAGTVSVGAGTFADVFIKMDAGTISMAEVSCNSFELKMDAGTMHLSQIQCDKFKANLDAGTLKATSVKCDDIDLELSAGKITLGVAGSKSDYTIRTDVSAGKCNLGNQSGGTKRLTVDVSAGKVTVNFDK